LVEVRRRQILGYKQTLTLKKYYGDLKEHTDFYGSEIARLTEEIAAS
jgi:hypothetical protein